MSRVRYHSARLMQVFARQWTSALHSSNSAACAWTTDVHISVSTKPGHTHRASVALSNTPNRIWSVLNAMHPIGRIGQLHEVAEVIAFLASDNACFVTGEVVRVDGGLMSQLPGSPTVEQ